MTSQPYNYGWGIPLDGDWIDVDDYFHQITSGGAINDVIHAKVVASTGVPYTCGDLVADGRVYKSSCHYSNDIYFRDIIAPFIDTEVEEEYVPDYKGKKPIEPRRRTRKVRTTHGAAVETRISTSRTLPNLGVDLKCFVPGRTQPRNNRYAVATLSFSISFNGKVFVPNSHVLLYPICEQVLSYFNSLFGEHGQYYSGHVEDYRDNIHQYVMSVINGNAYSVCDYVSRNYHRPGGPTPFCPWYQTRVVTDVTTDKVEGLRSCFMLDEPEILQSQIDPLALGGDSGLRSYWRNYLTQHALQEALETFPKLSDNSISNALEVIGFVKALVVDHRIEIPNSLADAWLSYRYQFKTTEMDVKEAVKFVRRNVDLGGLDRAISCRGTSRHTFDNGTEVTCRCECLVVPQIVNTATRLLRTLDTYGLNPDLYVLWDSIPFSFMVDWFAPIGDMLGVEDTNAKFLSGEFYKISWVCYSLSYTRKFQNAHVKCYSRWRGSVPTSMNSLYWLEPPSASSKTTVFRVLDAASIFIGF
jgi:hypothetical protein